MIWNSPLWQFKKNRRNQQHCSLIISLQDFTLIGKLGSWSGCSSGRYNPSRDCRQPSTPPHTNDTLWWLRYTSVPFRWWENGAQAAWWQLQFWSTEAPVHYPEHLKPMYHTPLNTRFWLHQGKLRNFSQGVPMLCLVTASLTTINNNKPTLFSVMRGFKVISNCERNDKTAWKDPNKRLKCDRITDKIRLVVTSLACRHWKPHSGGWVKQQNPH